MKRSDTYRLVDDGYGTFKKIMRGRSWVGRVVRTANGNYYARINNARGPATECYQPTEVAAFEEVVAMQFGYRCAAELHARNAEVRAANRERNARARELAYRFSKGDLTEKMAVIDEIFDGFEKKTRGAS